MEHLVLVKRITFLEIRHSDVELYLMMGIQIKCSIQTTMTWTEGTTTFYGLVQQVIYANGKYIAVGTEGNNYGRDPTALISSDGITWSEYKIEEADYRSVNGITWDGEKYIAVGYQTYMWKSTNGASWTAGEKDWVVVAIVYIV